MNERIVRLLAPNPSPLTLEGTNTYLVCGRGQAIVVDPGPQIPDHLAAIERALAERDLTLAAIAVTHGHPDHAPLGAELAARTGAPLYAHAAARFAHDRTLADGAALEIDGARLIGYDAPGHASDHLVFVEPEARVLFAGDVVIGRGTVVIAPPGGELRVYERTLARLAARSASLRAILPGHGPELAEPPAVFSRFLAHRREREAQIVAALEPGGATLPELVATIYRAYPRSLWPAAGRQVLAHLSALADEGRVRAEPLAREPTAAESAILRPDPSAASDPAAAAVAAAELGYDAGPPFARYALV